ncbi:hypothetical protein [Litchfieldella rifensis]|uniref:ATP synthase F0 subunit 8 n=1 Tax=Litchfieldella rifensis TaxID=762643 RepID=A0ABV7LKT1_9GAMM
MEDAAKEAFGAMIRMAILFGAMSIAYIIFEKWLLSKFKRKNRRK